MLWISLVLKFIQIHLAIGFQGLKLYQQGNYHFIQNYHSRSKNTSNHLLNPKTDEMIISIVDDSSNFSESIDLS